MNDRDLDKLDAAKLARRLIRPVIRDGAEAKRHAAEVAAFGHREHVIAERRRRHVHLERQPARVLTQS